MIVFEHGVVSTFVVTFNKLSDSMYIMYVCIYVGSISAGYLGIEYTTL